MYSGYYFVFRMCLN